MKVAILGVWHVHAKDYTKCAASTPGCEIVGVYDDNPEWRHAFATAHGIPEYGSADDLFAGEAEGVIVCTATDRHADDIVRAAKSGKHIFTEKVLALTEADCRRVADAVRERGVRFVISLPQKYSQGPRTVYEAVRRGEIGRVNYVRFRNCHTGSIGHWLPAHFYDPEHCGGGAMIDLGAHGMYLIDWFLGEPSTYQSTFTHVCRDERDAVLNPCGVEDNAVTVMSYESGAIAVNETGFVSLGCPMVLEVGGDEGYIRFERGRGVFRQGKNDSAPVELVQVPPLPLPIEQFLSGKILPGCGTDEALALTKMMRGAYDCRR